MENRHENLSGKISTVALYSLFFVFAFALYWLLDLPVQPGMSNDSTSYIHFPFDGIKRALTSVRTPGYPILLKLMSYVSPKYHYLPHVQFLLCVMGSALLLFGMTKLGLSRLVSFLTALGTLSHLVFMLRPELDKVLTDVPAAAFAAAAFGVLFCVVAEQRRNRRVLFLALLCLFSVLAWVTRPIYLTVVLCIPPLAAVLYWYRSRFDGYAGGLVKPILILCAVVIIPVLAYSSFRLAVVSDFHVISWRKYSAKDRQAFIKESRKRNVQLDGKESSNKLLDSKIESSLKKKLTGSRPVLFVKLAYYNVETGLRYAYKLFVLRFGTITVIYCAIVYFTFLVFSVWALFMCRDGKAAWKEIRNQVVSIGILASLGVLHSCSQMITISIHEPVIRRYMAGATVFCSPFFLVSMVVWPMLIVSVFRHRQLKSVD